MTIPAPQLGSAQTGLPAPRTPRALCLGYLALPEAAACLLLTYLLLLLRRLAASMSDIVYLTSCSLLASRMPDFSTAVPGLGIGLGLGL